MSQYPKWFAKAMNEAIKANAAELPWYRKDKLGWPIEGFKGKQVKSFVRLVCQNILKLF